MLLEAPGPIKLDGREVCQAFSLNLNPSKRQFRCKVQFDKLVDLAVYNYSIPHIDGAGVSISFNGKEMETDTEFEAKVGFSLLTRRWKLSGKIGRRPFSKECACLPEFIEYLKDLVYPVYQGTAPQSKVIPSGDSITIKVTINK